MNTNFESQVSAALQERADLALPDVEPAAAWTAVREHERSRKRRTSAVSLVAAVALLSGGVGVWKVQEQRSDTQQFATQDASEFRLVPSIFPETGTVTQIVYDFNRPQRSSRVRQWASGKSSIVLQEDILEPKDLGTSPPIDNQECRCISWADAQTEFYVQYSTAAGHNRANELANSVGRVASSPWAVVSAPIDLPLVVDDIASDRFAQGWGLSFDSRTVELLAQPIDDPYVAQNGINATWIEGELVTVRGLKGKITNEPGARVLIWEEAGTLLLMRGPDSKKLIELAETLRPASTAEFNDLLLAGSENATNSLAPSRVVVNAEDSQIATVQIADTATSTGCVNLQINEERKNLCVPVSNKPILWSGVRTIGDRKAFLLVTGPDADYAKLVSSSSPSVAGTVSSASIQARWLGGQEVTDISTGTSTWVGVMLVPFDDPSLDTIELFAIAGDQPEPAPQTDGESGEVTEHTVQSIGRYPI
jgi:hypothetical protein